ncbi:MAG: hypothetical protein WCP39_02445 [Chlamydiota bacterium]
MTISPLYPLDTYKKMPTDIYWVRKLWQSFALTGKEKPWEKIACKVLQIVCIIFFSFAVIPNWFLAVTVGNLYTYIKNTSFGRINDMMNHREQCWIKKIQQRDLEWKKLIKHGDTEKSKATFSLVVLVSALIAIPWFLVNHYKKA